MRGFARTVQQSNGVVNAASRNMLRRFVSTQRAIQDNARATRDMQRHIESLARSVDSLTQRLERAANVKPNSGGVLAMLGGKGAVGAAAIGAAVMAVSNGIGSAMRAAFERQKIQASYNILAGGRAQGEAMVGQLRTLMRDTMLGGEVFDIARTMMAFGVKGDIAGRIAKIGNVAMGDAGRMQSLGLALSQMSAAGKLQGQDRLQMINAGWNPINTIAEMSGKSAAQLNEEMSKGLITSDMVWKALDYATGQGGQFGGVLDAIAKTPAGQYMLMMGQWEELMVGLGESLMPIATDVMKFVNESVMPLVETYLPYLRESASYVWGVLQGWISALAPVRETFASLREEGGLMNQYVGGLWAIWQQIVPTVGRVLGFVGQLVGEFVQLLNKNELFKLAWDMVYTTAQALLGVVNKVVDRMQWMWQHIIRPIIESTTNWVNGALRAIGLTSKVPGVSVGASSMPGMSAGESDKLAAAQASALATMQSANAGSATAVSSGVASGGPKVVNITVGKLLDSITVSAANLKEGADEIEKVVLDTLARVLAQGAVIA
ncbi:MAG: tape measure protein [Bacteroidaceae bacterium]|nr:tape measure protein [Bacteroidaceae bacterium]